MTLVNTLAHKQAPILKSWFGRILESYPPETARLLSKEKNQFANPVGDTIRKGVEQLYRGLLQGDDASRLCVALDDVIRIRAVQDFPPARALEFVFALKGIIRGEVLQEIADGTISADELAHLDASIDQLGLLAFNTYMECREKIYELRVSEVNNRTARIIQRLNMVGRNTEQESKLEDSNNINPT
jgi:hypothetical protein